MLDNGGWEKLMVMVFMSGQMEIDIKDTSNNA